MDFLSYNQEQWDKKAEDQDIWSIPVSSEAIQNAKRGEWTIVLTPHKPSWFPETLTGKKVLSFDFIVHPWSNGFVDSVLPYGEKHTGC
jgi:hypothetical protein